MGQESGIAVSYGLGHRQGSDPMLLQLWRKLAAAAPIEPLAWALPYAMGSVLKRQQQQQGRLEDRVQEKYFLEKVLGGESEGLCGFFSVVT